MAFLFRKNNNHFYHKNIKKVNTHVSVQIHKHKTKLSLSSITTYLSEKFIKVLQL